MEINRDEKKIFNALFQSSEGLMPYTLYKRHKMSPGTVFTFIDKFSSKGLVSIEGEGRIKLTKEGSIFVVESSFGILTEETNRFEKIPLRFLADRIEINEFYLPNASDFLKDYVDLRDGKGQ